MAEFRRREEEKQVNLRENARTEFTEGLDRFDSALDKFKKNVYLSCWWINYYFLVTFINLNLYSAMTVFKFFS